MNVWMLTSAFHPTVGGAETYAQAVASALASAGHRVHVLTDAVGDVGSEPTGSYSVSRLGAYWDLVNDPTKHRWEQMAFAVLRDVLDAAGPETPDVIFANNMETAILGDIIALDLDRPLVCMFHEQSPEAGPYGRGRARFAFQRVRATMYLAGSEFYGDRALEFGAPRERLRVIRHGIDLEHFVPQEDGRTISGRIVCAGRIAPRKNQRRLIEAFRHVNLTLPHTSLHLVGKPSSGDPAYYEACRMDVEGFEPGDHVRIDPNKSLADMPDVYASAEVVVVPSLAEGLGYAALEAMASRRPVVASAIPGLLEVIPDTRFGELIDPEDPRAMAQAILRLLGDTQRAGEIKEEALRRVTSEFSFETMIRSTISALQDAVDSHRQRD